MPEMIRTALFFGLVVLALAAASGIAVGNVWARCFAKPWQEQARHAAQAGLAFGGIFIASVLVVLMFVGIVAAVRMTEAFQRSTAGAGMLEPRR